MNNPDYKDGHRITLHGTSFLALEQFLKDNPQAKEIAACLDNDETGIRRADKMCREFSKKGYQMFMRIPKQKDYNEQLLRVIKGRNQSHYFNKMEL